MKISMVSVNGSFVPPNSLKPDGQDGFYPHHFQSTPQDNLIELAGRVCYDSTKQSKTRNSSEYHQHINEVNHRSTQEHVNFTISIDRHDLLPYLINRPGVWVETTPNGIRLTINVRAINEWYDRSCELTINTIECQLGNLIYTLCKPMCPLAIMDNVFNPDTDILPGKLVRPIYTEESWVSFYISGVSRNLSHELVRHKWRTAVSQRSTRYVDESDNDWAWSPLIKKYVDENNILTLDNGWNINLAAYQLDAAKDYQDITKYLEHKLIEGGVSKFDARKQARGAARGVLGSCLSTELIFSASIAQWVRMIDMRMSPYADAEIRMLFNRIYDELVLHQQIHARHTKPSTDGLGFCFE